MIDWYDKNQCHHNNVNGHDRSNGRIFKIIYNNEKWTPVDLQKATDEQLVQYQLNANEWYVRHARRLLQERGPNPKVHTALSGILQNDPDAKHRLHALWALHVTDGLTEEFAAHALNDADAYIRGWTIQLITEQRDVSKEMLDRFAASARNDPSPIVRLYLASALQRLPLDQRRETLEGLFAHESDTNDHNLPLMYWYAAEPLAGSNPLVAANLLAKSKIPLLREFVSRRMTASANSPEKKPQKTASVK